MERYSHIMAQTGFLPDGGLRIIAVAPDPAGMLSRPVPERTGTSFISVAAEGADAKIRAIKQEYPAYDTPLTIPRLRYPAYDTPLTIPRLRYLDYDTPLPIPFN